MQKPFKHRWILTLLLIIGFVLIIKAPWSAEIEPSADFGAFYSTIDSNGFSIIQSNNVEEADIIVELGEENGRLVFLTSENYLPYWETKYKKKYFDNDLYGNLDGFNLKNNSKEFMFSTASIAENSKNKAVIQLKHQTKNSTIINNSNSEYNTEFIDEYFIVYNNGAIERRILKRNISPGSNGAPTDLIVKYFMLTKVSIKKKARKVDNNNILTSLLPGYTFLKISNPE